MNSFPLSKKRILHCKVPIILLSIIALLGFFLNCLVTFVIEIIHGSFSMPLYNLFPFFNGLLSDFVAFLPYIFFLLYVFGFYKKAKGTVIISMVFILFAILPILSLIETRFSHISYYLFYGDISGLIRIIADALTRLAFTLPLIIIYILTAISALKGFSSNKVFIIIVAVLNLLTGCYTFINAISLYAFLDGLYFFQNLIGFLTEVAFGTALLLFGIKNRISPLLSSSPEKEKKIIEKMKPKKALERLKDNYDFGTITEAEYQLQRAEIIGKL